MADSDAPIGLVACTECGSIRSIRRSGDGARSAGNCQQCGNDSFTDLRDPSEI